MTSFRFKHTFIESIAVNLPPIEVASSELEDRLSPLYERLEIPFGTLEKLSGVKTRYFWDRTVPPSVAGFGAAEAAIGRAGFSREQIGALFSCSVTRDYFEPATASLVHGRLGLPETSMSMDITNACLGFSNGVLTLANMIEAGQVKAGVVVSGETISPIIDSSIDRMMKSPNMTREELLKLLPTFTLGSGAAAVVLCHESIATSGHRVLGAVARSASEFRDLCVGNADFCFYMPESELDPLMHTESSKLISSAAFLGGRTWTELSKLMGWSSEEIDKIFCHQVGRQLGDGFYREMGLDNKKEFTIYKKYGNQVSAALPSALGLGVESDAIASGSKIVLTGFGSGLNSLFTAISW